MAAPKSTRTLPCSVCGADKPEGERCEECSSKSGRALDLDQLETEFIEVYDNQAIGLGTVARSCDLISWTRKLEAFVREVAERPTTKNGACGREYKAKAQNLLDQ